MTGRNAPSQPQLAARQSESSVFAVAEMNLEEYPAFRLGRRSKRPELRYVRTRAEPDGRTLQQLWIVRGAEPLGLPGPFEQDLYVALLVLFTEQGLPSDGRIRFTRNRLTQVMGCSNSGRGYELLEQGLSRLAGASIHTEHAFFRPGAMGANGERSGPAERLSLDFHILEEVRVYERRAAAGETSGASEGEDAALQVRVEHARPFELSVTRLGLPLVQSFERRYTKSLDATYYFSLTRPLAKRLYRYLDKVRNGRGSFEIGVRPLADVLGLEYRYPSDIKDVLVEAHAELQATGYLTSAAYAPLAGGPNAGEKVAYAFQPAFDRRPRRRAGAALPPAAPQSPPTERLPQDERAQHAHARVAAAGTRPGEAPSEAPPAETSGAQGIAPVVAPVTVTGSVPVIAPGRQPSPLQAELESFGISPARAAVLVGAYPEAHIDARVEYVRSLLQRKGPRPLKNPAGFLAKAIEDGYTVPDRVAPAARPAPALPPPEAEAAVPRDLPAGNRERPPAAAAPAEMPAASVGAPGPGAAAGQPEPQASAAAPADSGAGVWAQGVWAQLAAALKARLSGATYAAWIAPACCLAPDGAAPVGGGGSEERGNEERGAGVAPAEGGDGIRGGPAAGAVPAGERGEATRSLTVVLPTAFALDRWRRPPIAPALADAAAALGVSVTMRHGAAPPEP